MDYTITLPGGDVLEGADSVVVVGPNGSGKSKQTRLATSPAPIEIVNALRNTRVSPNIPAMGFDDAKATFANHRSQALSSYWEQTQDFDSMLSQLLAQNAMADKEFVRRFRRDPASAGMPPVTALSRVEDIWSDVFPGRELLWDEWKPKIVSSTDGSNDPIEYSGSQMSDGEKAALYLAGRVLSASPGILIVDEPETHLHTLLAISLWDVLERERKDLRFVYITHDLTFALSRPGARYVLANPVSGLKALDLKADLPDDIAEVLLGSASLSFYAKRVVFTEGTTGSIDNLLYNAWFKGRDTVVRGVGNCEMVIRCADALAQSGLTQSLTATGIIDADFHSETYRTTRSSRVYMLAVHEAESLICLPGVVEAIKQYKGQGSLNHDLYRDSLSKVISDAERHRVIIERWKNRVEPELTSLMRQVKNRDKPVTELLDEVGATFDQANWNFDPADMLEEEKSRVESATSILEILSIFPGKAFVAIAASQAGESPSAYKELIAAALTASEGPLLSLGGQLETVWSDYLPHRTAA